MTAASEKTEPLTASDGGGGSKRERSRAWKRVRANKGGPGIDGMTVEEMPGYLRKHWPRIREELLCGDYIPSAGETGRPYPSPGGTRESGVPVALDRSSSRPFCRCSRRSSIPNAPAVMVPGEEALTRRWSRPRKIAEGYAWVADLDLEKFFDRVNQDILMERLAMHGRGACSSSSGGCLQAGVSSIHGVVRGGWEGPRTRRTPVANPR